MLFVFFFILSREPVGLEDVSTYPELFAELIRRGWSDDELVKLAGKNLIRVFTRVEQVTEICCEIQLIKNMESVFESHKRITFLNNVSEAMLMGG